MKAAAGRELAAFIKARCSPGVNCTITLRDCF